MWAFSRLSFANVRPLVCRIVGAIAAGWLIVWFFGGITGIIGNLVKYRAQYFPSHDLPPETVIATTYWDIAERTKWLEGKPGLVRGLVTIFFGVLFALFIDVMDKLGRPLPKDPVSTTLFWFVLTPINVVTIRAITTPVLLPFFDIPLALDVLLTPDERARPWQLYLLPGIIPLLLLQTTWTKFIFPRLRDMILPRVPHYDWRYGLSTTRMVALALAMIDTVVANPMDVVAVRLALMDVSDAFTVNEPVLNLRTGKAPYAGIWDCVRCIIEEEGIETLCRGWMLLLLVKMTSVLKVKKDVPGLKTKEQDEEMAKGKPQENCEGHLDLEFADEKVRESK